MTDERFPKDQEQQALQRIYQAALSFRDEIGKPVVKVAKPVGLALTWGVVCLTMGHIVQGDQGAFAALMAASPILARVIDTIGGDLLAGLVEKVAGDETLTDEEIRDLLAEALAETNLSELLTEREFYRAVRILESRDTVRHEEVTALLQGILALLSSLQQEPTVPRQSLPRAAHFTGREDEVIWLTGALEPGRVVTLTGPGGVGKTALGAAALEALEKSGDLAERFPDGVIRYTFYGQPETRLCLAHVARSVFGEGTDDVSPEAAQRGLAGKQVLLILDGAEASDDLGAVLRARGKCGALLTTRDRMQVQEAQWWLEVQPLPTGEAEKMMESVRGEGIEAETRAALAREVDGLPLAVQLVGAYLAATGRSSGSYLDWLREQPLAALNQGERQAENIEVLLGRSVAQVSAGARGALEVLGCLASVPIEGTFLAETLEDGERALDELARFCLVRREGEMVTVSHALIHGYARRRLAMREGRVEELATVVLQEIERLNEKGYPGPLLKWLPHAQAMMEQVRMETELVGWMCNTVGYALWMLGDYPKAKLYYERALVIRKRVLGMEHLDTAQSLSNLGFLLELMGDYAIARLYLEQALVIRERSLGAEHPDTALSLNNLGRVLDSMGDYTTARLYLERALAIWEKVLGTEHPDTATSLNNLGHLLQAMGEYAEARTCFERALAIREKVLGSEHPDTATSLNNLGMLLWVIGDYTGAQTLLKRTLATRERVLGMEHPHTALSLNNLGVLLFAMKDYERVRGYYERALAIREKVLGAEHPDIAQSLNNLGALLHVMGEYAEARTCYERALAINEQMVGAEHPNTALRLNNLGRLLLVMGDYAGAKRYLVRALAIQEKVLGTDHPDTARSLKGLGDLLQAMGDYVRAREFYERALGILEQKLEMEHPYTRILQEKLEMLKGISQPETGDS